MSDPDNNEWTVVNEQTTSGCNPPDSDAHSEATSSSIPAGTSSDDPDISEEPDEVEMNDEGTDEAPCEADCGKMSDSGPTDSTVSPTSSSESGMTADEASSGASTCDHQDLEGPQDNYTFAPSPPTLPPIVAVQPGGSPDHDQGLGPSVPKSWKGFTLEDLQNIFPDWSNERLEKRVREQGN